MGYNIVAVRLALGKPTLSTLYNSYLCLLRCHKLRGVQFTETIITIKPIMQCLKSIQNMQIIDYLNRIIRDFTVIVIHQKVCEYITIATGFRG